MYQKSEISPQTDIYGKSGIAQILSNFSFWGSHASPLEPKGNFFNSIPKTKKKVLIVDDSPVNRIVLNSFLKADYDCYFAEHGEEAIRKYKQYKIDIVLMDIEMPVMGGIEAALKIREIEEKTHTPRIPIIAVTTIAEAVKEKIIDIMDGCIDKPRDAETILNIMDKVLGASYKMESFSPKKAHFPSLVPAF